MSDIQERLNELDRALEQLRMPLDVTQRLHNAEQAINRMQARQDQAEADIIDGNEEMLDRIKIVDIARARGNEGQHDLVTRTANAIYKELKALEGQFASTSRVERISEELGELRGLFASHKKIFFSAVGDLNNRIEMLEDAATWVPPDDTKITSEPSDTSWHPFNFSTDLRPDDGKRVMTLVRGGNNITGPWRAGGLNWAECDDETIIAWRYAKEGE